jgi:hypothetical protein
LPTLGKGRAILYPTGGPKGAAVGVLDMTGHDVKKSVEGPNSGPDQERPRSGSAFRETLPFGEPRRGKQPFESDRARLLGEISRVLEDLDETGLVQLLDTASMIRYNQSLLRATEEVQGEELPFEEVNPLGLRIERSSDGSTYHLLAGQVWKILAAEEIASILRIARHEESEMAASRHLYQWIRQERRDIAVDLHIPSGTSPVLKELLGLLRATFPVRTPRRP